MKANLTTLYLFMQHRYYIAIPILLILALPAVSQLCPASGTNTNDLLQAGTTLISNSYINTPAKRQHLFTFTLNFNAPLGLRVAASASSLQITPTNGIDFSIWGGQGSTSTTGMIILMINEDNSWSSIRVSYLASGRSDFFLGSFVAALYLSQRRSENNAIMWNEAVVDPIPTQRNYIIVVEIAGLKTLASSAVVSLTGVNFNPNTSIISTTITLASNLLIEHVVITYIIADRSSPITFAPFAVSSGSTATYQFIGIDQLQGGSGVFAGNGFTSATTNGLTCVGSGCPSSCVTSQQCITYFGVLTATNCYICAQGQIVSNGQCVNPIPPCSANQYYNGSTCVCNNGFILIGTTCFVSCGSNAYVNNSQCQCIPGYVINPNTNQCVLNNTICANNFVWINNRCVCPTGFGIINGVCMVCPPNSFVDQNGNCVCAPGFILNTNTRRCDLACPANSFRNSLNQCVCNPGYFNQSGTCVLQNNCPNTYIWNGNACVCPSGTVVDNFTNSCTPCNSLGRVISNGRCVCHPSFYPTDTTCIPCIPNSSYNPTTRVCVCNQNYVLINNQCTSITCPANSSFNTVTQQCVCNVPGQYPINNTCQPCPQFSFWDGMRCACQSGYILAGSTCILNCTANSYWNGSGCACNNGFFFVSGSCQICDPNSYYSFTQSTCICNNGFFGTWNNCTRCDPSCLTCSGPSNSQCLTCPTNTVLVGGTCRSSCAAGTYLSSSNQCLPCDSTCATCTGPSSNSCTSCINGLTLTSGSCRSIPPPPPANVNSRLTLNGFVLGNQIIYQGVSLSLMPTAILSDNCNICNNLFMITVNSRFATITVNQQFVSNTQYRFIISFAFPNVATVPSFEFTIRINPTYASYFTSPDMAQLLTGSFTPDQFSTSITSASPRVGDSRTPRVIAPSVVAADVVSAGSIRELDDKAIQYIFGSGN